MGSVLSGNKMAEMQLKTMQRQLNMQNMMRERGMAMQIARQREMLNWTGSFYGLTVVALLAGFSHTKSKGLLAPLLPLTFIIGYQADLAYGTKMHRIREEAENILLKEMNLLDLPEGLPTVNDIDNRIESSK